MVFLQGAARRESPAGTCLDLAWWGHIELCVSDEILAKVENVLARPRIRERFPVLDDTVVEGFLAAVKERSRYFSSVPRRLTLSRDPKDEPYLNLALLASANYLVSRDADLLDLAAGTDAESRAVQEAVPELRIVDPVAFLMMIRGGGRMPGVMG